MSEEIAKKLNLFFTLRDNIYDLFEYREPYYVLPLEDCRECYWVRRGDMLIYADQEFTASMIEDEDYEVNDYNIEREHAVDGFILYLCQGAGMTSKQSIIVSRGKELEADEALMEVLWNGW